MAPKDPVLAFLKAFQRLGICPKSLATSMRKAHQRSSNRSKIEVRIWGLQNPSWGLWERIWRGRYDCKGVLIFQSRELTNIW